VNPILVCALAGNPDRDQGILATRATGTEAQKHEQVAYTDA
jgi:hypothetical protein